MGQDVGEVLGYGSRLVVVGLLTGLVVALGAGLVLGSTGADLVVTAVAGLLAGNAGGVAAAVVGVRTHAPAVRRCPPSPERRWTAVRSRTTSPGINGC